MLSITFANGPRSGETLEIEWQETQPLPTIEGYQPKSHRGSAATYVAEHRSRYRLAEGETQENGRPV